MSLLEFLRNLANAFRYDWLAELHDCQVQLQEQNARLLQLELQNVDDPRFSEELRYIRALGHPVVFPYPPAKSPEPVVTGNAGGFPFAVHKGKRLFFPKTWTELRVEAAYRNFVENENILAVDQNDCFLKKAPHQYQSESVRVQKGDTVVDIGAAEGLFSLDAADLAGKIYLVENDPQWFTPLRLTFAPYAEKTVIVRKSVGSTDSRHSVRLSTILSAETEARCFVKMDIEGAEVAVVESCLSNLTAPRDICWACCTYHGAEDADILERLFLNAGYTTEFSDGWMLVLAKQLASPFFRKGVIRAFPPRAASAFSCPPPAEGLGSCKMGFEPCVCDPKRQEESRGI